MRRLVKISMLAFGLLLAAFGAFAIPTIWGTPWSIDHFYMRFLVKTLLPFPQVLTITGALRPLTFYEDDLNDYSQAAFDDLNAMMRRELQILRSYDRDAMSTEGQLSYDVMEFWIEYGLLSLPVRFRLHRLNIEQMEGIHVSLPDFMINNHDLDSAKMADFYVDRVSKFGTAFDQVIAGAREREDAGILPPRFILTKVRDDASAFIQSAAEANPLFTHFRDKTSEIEDLSAQQRKVLLQRLKGELDNTVYPAYGRYLALVEAWLSEATDEAGVWRLPDGDAYYDYMLKKSTTSQMTADEVHQLGLSKVEEVQAEIRAILEKQGYEVTVVGDALRRLAQEPRFRFENTEEAKQQVILAYNEIIKEMEAGVDALFELRPKVGVTVKRTPAFREKTAAFAYYQPPPMDFSKPGSFFVNMRGINERPSFGLRTLSYHEAIPGHHFQIAIALGLKDLPMFRKLLPFTAFSEGWAMYAEYLAAESGYQDDPFDRIGYLSAQLTRAVRLVVDTGIHRKRWTRQQAVDYMLANSGEGEKEVQAEIDRYCVWPGQATAYMVGQLKILQLRQRMREARGADFDIKDFHNRVLGNGALPLYLLERVVLADR